MIAILQNRNAVNAVLWLQMKKAGVLILLVAAFLMGKPISTFSQTNFETVEQHVPYLDYERLQVSMGKYQQWARQHPNTTGFVANGTTYIGWCKLDSAHGMRGYFTLNLSENSIGLVCKASNNDKILLTIEAAKFAEIPGTMRAITNTWLVDVDGDGSKEILTTEDLKDFEFETPESSNISSTMSYCYRFANGKYVYERWPEGINLGPIIP